MKQRKRPELTPVQEQIMYILSSYTGSSILSNKVSDKRARRTYRIVDSEGCTIEPVVSRVVVNNLYKKKKIFRQEIDGRIVYKPEIVGIVVDNGALTVRQGSVLDDFLSQSTMNKDRVVWMSASEYELKNKLAIARQQIDG